MLQQTSKVHVLRCRICGHFLSRSQSTSHTHPGNKIKSMFEEIKVGVESFDRNDRHFIKFFLLDATVNANEWGVTAQAVRRDINTFLGKPFLLTSKFDHTNGKDPHTITFEEQAEVEQEFKIGTIIEVGIDDSTGKAFGIAEIHDKEALDTITAKAMFVSPSLSINDADVIQQGNTQIITRFTASHVAAVQEPAFGIIKAQIKGTCAGTESECKAQLKTVQAKVIGKVTHYYAQSPCVDECLRKKEEAGITIDDEAIAVCLSECGESEEQQDAISLGYDQACHLESCDKISAIHIRDEEHDIYKVGDNTLRFGVTDPIKQQLSQPTILKQIRENILKHHTARDVLANELGKGWLSEQSKTVTIDGVSLHGHTDLINHDKKHIIEVKKTISSNIKNQLMLYRLLHPDYKLSVYSYANRTFRDVEIDLSAALAFFRERALKYNKIVPPSVITSIDTGSAWIPPTYTDTGTSSDTSDYKVEIPNTSFEFKRDENNLTMEQQLNLEAQINDLTAKLNTEKTAREEIEKKHTELTTQFNSLVRQPYVDQILEAKLSLGTIKAESKEEESKNLFDRDVIELKHLAGEYQNLVAAKKEMSESQKITGPRYLSGTVSVDDSDALIAKLRGTN